LEKAQGSELRAQRKIARDLGFGGQKRLRAKSTGKGAGHSRYQSRPNIDHTTLSNSLLSPLQGVGGWKRHRAQSSGKKGK